MPDNKGPIPGAAVCERYHIDPDAWTGMDPSERAMFRMAYAADVWHVEEHPRGSNSGQEINRVLNIAGVDSGNPWCAAIWTAYLVDSGVPRANLPPMAASVHGWGEWASEHRRLVAAPERGMAGLLYHSATTGHLVVVTHVDGDSIATIEGNTNLDGSREGYGVFRRERTIKSCVGFVHCVGLI